MTSLQGRRVVITRPRPAAEALVRELSSRGATPIIFPTITLDVTDEGLNDFAPALAALRPGDWVVVTSPFAADLVGAKLATGSHGSRVAAVGHGTAAVLERHGVRVQAIPSEARGEAIADALGDLFGRRVLVPGSAIGRPETVAALLRRGAEARGLTIYRTATAPPSSVPLHELRRGIDAILFTSPSTVRGFLAAVGADAGDLLDAAMIVCIGPTTAAAVREAGMRRSVIAPQASSAGLLAALDQCFSPPPPVPT